MSREVTEYVPLAPYSTFQIGGPARYFIRVSSIDEVQEALAFAQDRSLKTVILGGGSNVLIADEGFDGVVIKIELAGVTEREEGGEVRITAAAGESWDALVARAAAQELWGIENLAGIPGTMGGAVVQNIGAYGAALSSVLRSVEVFDTKELAVRTLARDECRFAYRGSLFKDEDGRYVVLAATLALSRTPAPNLAYKDLATQAAGGARLSTPEEIARAVRAIRAYKFPDLAQEGTAGSFFKNPVLPALEAQALAARYPGLPLFSLAESADIKVPLGWLLDYRHGVIDMRDTNVGGARMYERQFLVIAAARGTQASSVRALMRIVQQRVHDACGIEIEPEVTII